LRDRFVLNTENFGEYYKLIDEDKLPLNRGRRRDQHAQMRWAIVLPIKNRDVYKSTFKDVSGESLDNVFRPKFERLKSYGLLREDDITLGLTPSGAFFADEIAHQFHAEEHIPYGRDEYADGPLNPYIDTEPYVTQEPALAVA
jgi:oxygen-independent coproporphyrinogen-3 oxidase